MTFKPSWLLRFGFHTDSYSRPQAENLPEDLIKPLFVYSVFEPRFSDPDLNILSYPGSTVIHGWGKTMGLRWLTWWAKDKREVQGMEDCPIVVPYTHFQSLLAQPAPYTAKQHAAPLMAAFAMAFLLVLNEVDQIYLHSLEEQNRRNWWGFLNQYLPAGWQNETVWNNLPDDIKKNALLHQDALWQFGDDLEESLGQITSWLQKIGFQRIYIAVDNITGYPQTKDTRVAANLVASLIETDQLFHIPGVYWKIFISDTLKESLGFTPENRPRRYRVFPIAWNQERLLDMVNKTLQVCTDHLNPSGIDLADINDLIDRVLQNREPPMDIELAQLALRYPGSPPQNMLMFVNELFQRMEEEDSAKITEAVASAYINKIKRVIQRFNPVQQAEPAAPEEAPVQEMPLVMLERELIDLENQHDYVLYAIDCSDQIQKIQAFIDKVEKYSQAASETLTSTAPADKNQLQLLDQKAASFAEMKQRAQRLKASVQSTCYILDAYPATYRNWTARAVDAMTQVDLQDVKCVLEALENFSTDELLPVLKAVNQVQLSSRQSSLRHGQLINEGQQFLRQADNTFNDRKKLSILIAPLLLRMDAEPVIDGDIQAFWQQLVQHAKQIYS